jgi:polyisoprenoid-binding protein YceI
VKKHWKKIALIAVLLAVLAPTAGVWLYIHVIKSEPKKALTVNDIPVGTVDQSATTDNPSTPAAGNTWSITTGSQVGYRVVEVLFGQDTEGVGRTNSVTGSLTLDDTKVSAATFTVDMKTLVSDDARRDRKFTGGIMNTATIPTSTFTLTSPIDLGTNPADGQEIKASATGDLLLHGVTKSVTFDVTAKRTGGTIAVAGSIDVKFADYNINNPSGGPVTTQDHGLIEFALAFSQG